MASERLDVGTPREILIVMLSALGDAVHVLPVANALRRAFPQACITWVIQPVPYALVASHPAIDEFIIFRRQRGMRALSAYADLRRRFAGRHFDLVLNLQVYLKAGLITALAPADIKLGFDRARARDLNWLFTTHKIPSQPTGHVQDQYFEFLEYIGVNPDPVEWRITLSVVEKEAQEAFFSRIDRAVCAIVVGTSKSAKNWAPEHYARLIEHIDADFGMQCVMVGGPSKIERDAAEDIATLTRAPVINSLGDDIRRLVYLLAGSALVVSPDTGPLHIARALNVPVVGLYGYSNPKRYGPYRRFTDLIVDGYARVPGEQYGPSMEWRKDGMARITVEMVLDKVALAVKKYTNKFD